MVEEFHNACRENNIEKITKMFDGGFNDINVIQQSFLDACSLGMIELARTLYNHGTIDVHQKNDWSISYACLEGGVEMMHFLLSLNGKDKINIHADNEILFMVACDTQHHTYIPVIRLLLSLTGEDQIDIHINDDHAFKIACWWGNIDLVNLLLEKSIKWKVTEKVDSNVQEILSRHNIISQDTIIDERNTLLSELTKYMCEDIAKMTAEFSIRTY